MHAGRQIELGKVTKSKGDFGYSGHERGNEAHDRVEREAWPNRKLKSAYSSIVGDIPTLGPSDFVSARAVLGRIREAIERGGWTRNEWRRLRGLESKWAARASGADRRFNHIGNRKTGLNRNQLFEIRCSVDLSQVKKAVKTTIADSFAGYKDKGD